MGFPNKIMNFFLRPTRVLEMFLNNNGSAIVPETPAYGRGEAGMAERFERT
jgi:hypothetical protein